LPAPKGLLPPIPEEPLRNFAEVEEDGKILKEEPLRNVTDVEEDGKIGLPELPQAPLRKFTGVEEDGKILRRATWKVEEDGKKSHMEMLPRRRNIVL
jgi:hypothetical protein